MANIGALRPQDGVDDLLRALNVLVNDRKRSDFYCVVMGSGDSLDDLRALNRELGLEDVVDVAGWE